MQSTWTGIISGRRGLKHATAEAHQDNRHRCHALAIACLTGFLGASAVLAQDVPEELFTPVPQTQVATSSPEQSRRLEQIRNRKTTESVEVIRVNEIALRANQLRVSIAGRAAVTLSKKSGETSNGTVVSWSGTGLGKGSERARATFVVVDSEISGSIHVEGALYRILPLGGGAHALVKVDTRKMPPDHEPGAQQAADVAPRYGINDDVEPMDTGPARIDVLVAYTPAAAAAAGMTSTIALAIKEANDSYENSVVNVRLKAVDVFQLPFSEAGKSYVTLVSQFKNNATVNQRRNSSGADIAVLIVDQDDACGRADAIMATASSAYAVVHYDCATGYYSFAHELGHLMGARHNQQEDSSTTPYPFGHGYRHDAAPDFRTIMSYDCPAGCERVQYWSNPRLTYLGVPTGTVSTNDNARVLNITARTLAAFRNQPVPDGTIWRYTGVPCTGSSCPGWQMLDNNTSSRDIVKAHGFSSGDLYQLHKDGKIWRHTGVPCSGAFCPGWQLLDNNPNTVAIAASSSGGVPRLYQLHKDGRIWRYTGVPCSGGSCPGWQLLDNNPSTVAIEASGSNLYQRHYNGRIWRYTGVPCTGSFCPGWQLLDNNPRTMSIVADGNNLYQLHNTGRIWRYTGVPCSGSSCPGWQLLDNNPRTVELTASGGFLYQRHDSGLIWRHTGVPCSGSSCPGWQLLDNNPRTRTILADGFGLYQLHSTGVLWRYTGVPCSGASCPGWQALDNNSRTVGIAAGAGQLYQIHGVQ